MLTWLSVLNIPGAKAPKLVTNDMVKQMRPGSVIVDAVVDQGGVEKLRIA